MATKSILDCTNDEARTFFLQSSQYSNLDLPKYFDFDGLISAVATAMPEDMFKNGYKTAAKQEGVNYRLLTNKDGRYSWRPVELIHPVLYVELVNIITQKDNWNKIKTRIAQLNKSAKKIEGSAGWPRLSTVTATQKATQVSTWWSQVEQRSLALGLEYTHLIKADVTNCYGTIYTHSIAWAVHTKPLAKRNHKAELFGNKMDNCIQAMQYGETKGIPQGSVLMDFVAELVLADIDGEVAAKVKNVKSYKILRYRDDYSIFVNDPLDGRKILKALSEVLASRGMQMNTDKAIETDDVISGSLKQDKLDILNLPLFAVKMQSNSTSSKLTTINSFQKTLLQVYGFSQAHPNSGALVRVLQDIRERLETLKIPKNAILPSASILTNMLERNPRLIPVAIPLIGDLTDSLPDKDKPKIVQQLINKLGLIPNTGQLDVFVQAMAYTTLKKQEYDEALTAVVRKDSKQKGLWENSWLSDKALRQAVEKTSIINREVLNNTKWSSPARDTALFATTYRNS